MVRHPRHVSYLASHASRLLRSVRRRVRRRRVETQRQQRRLIHQLDKAALHPARVRGHFANGRTNYRAVDTTPTRGGSSPLQGTAPSAGARRVSAAATGRVRVSSGTSASVEARGSGRPSVQAAEARHPADDRRDRRRRAAASRLAADGDPRIRFLGRVSDEQLLDLFAGALVVPFVPVQEDYGLITIEAFKSQKPVITCSDSGETLQFVKDGVNRLRRRTGRTARWPIALEFLIDHPEARREMGKRGSRAVAHINWESIVSALLRAATARTSRNRARAIGPASAPRNGRTRQPVRHSSTKVTVLDMQPIEPAVGGGRLRLLGLYHDLGAAAADDLRRHLRLAWPGLPRSPADRHAQGDRRSAERSALRGVGATGVSSAGGKTVIDVSFPMLAHHSPEFVKAAQSRGLRRGRRGVFASVGVSARRRRARQA